ncbi:uncharacterized protein LOC128954412 [Oppia nitens]|uniref:uncharacterized protein LOC128954412 n=1 Tax=Oppia nitens TaxID=1686743 RepID=UPI0023DB4C5A|nr:uncharacterized protein LOC128954412 [Oppia nitens]
MNRQSFDRFGDNLVKQLIRYLPTVDKLRLQSMSKQFQRAIETIIKVQLRFDGKQIECVKTFGDFKRGFVDTKVKDIVKLAKDSFDRFDDELCRQLLTGLSIGNRLRLQLVCKCFRRVIFSTQTDLYFNGNQLIKQYKHFGNNMFELFETLVKNFPNLSRVSITGIDRMTDDYLQLLMKYCPELQRLSILTNGSRFWSLTEPTVDMFFGKHFAKQLRSIRINTFDPKIVVKWLPLLDQLEKVILIEDSDEHRFNHLIHLYDGGDSRRFRLPKLLNLLNIQVTADADYVSLFRQFAGQYGRQLKLLDLTLLSYFDGKNCHRLVQTMALLSQLRGFHVILNKTNADQYLVAMVDHLANTGDHQLTGLTIVGGTLNKPTIVQLMAIISEHRGGRRLKRFNISVGTRYDADDQWSLTKRITSLALKSMNRLTHLSIYVTTNRFADEFLANIGQHLPRLEYLDMPFVGITDKTVSELAKLRHLRSLRLTDVDNTDIGGDGGGIGKQLVIKLIQKQPKLTNVFVNHNASNKFIMGNLFYQ